MQAHPSSVQKKKLCEKLKLNSLEQEVLNARADFRADVAVKYLKRLVFFPVVS
jgi:hypothetical protein